MRAVLTRVKSASVEIDGEIVSYENVYRFYAPDADITVTAVFVASDADVKEAVNIRLTVLHRILHIHHSSLHAYA